MLISNSRVTANTVSLLGLTLFECDTWVVLCTPHELFIVRDYQHCSVWSDVARLLLLLSGDIELNPGPTTSFVQTNDRTVFTDKKVHLIILFCTPSFQVFTFAYRFILYT